jgi:hypothetical protein
MRRIALTLASAVLVLVGCASNPPAKTATDRPADPHNAVGGDAPDNLNSTATSQGNAPKEEQKNDKADETKSEPKK